MPQTTMNSSLPEPTQPLSEDLTDLCPGCGGLLEHVVGWYKNWDGEHDFDGVRCPNHCVLEDFYG